MQRSKERLSSKAASLVLGLGLVLAGPAIAGGPAYAQQSGSRSDLAIESDVLKALGNYPDINSEQITATTQNGVVTLNGSASNSTAIGQAQVVAATVDGVRSVVNHVKVTAGTGASGAQAGIRTAQQQTTPGIDQEPVQAQSPDAEQQQPPQPVQQPGTSGNWGPAGPPPDVQNGQVPPPQENQGQQGPAQSQGRQQADGYPIEDPGGQEPGGQQAQVPPPPSGQNAPRPPYAAPYGQAAPGPNPAGPGGYGPGGYGPGGYGQGGYGGNGYPQQRRSSYPPVKLAATPLTVPEHTLLTIRTSEPLDSRRVQAGESFQAVVAQDIYEGEYLAVPRGAVVEGHIVGVKKPGAFAGSAGFALQITSLNLGGHSYPVATDTFATDTRGKGGYTTGNTIGGAAIGAIIGGIAGRGPGAAIGAVAGGAVGAGASAATPGPREVMPPETLLTFHLREPVTVDPITYGEVQRLQASVQPPRAPRPRPYPYAYGYPPPPPPPPYYYYPYRY
jgi:BON domain